MLTWGTRSSRYDYDCSTTPPPPSKRWRLQGSQWITGALAGAIGRALAGRRRLTVRCTGRHDSRGGEGEHQCGAVFMDYSVEGWCSIGTRSGVDAKVRRVAKGADKRRRRETSEGSGQGGSGIESHSGDHGANG